MINIFEVNETNKMIEQENLDVRTITMGISLLDCIDPDLDALNQKIYEKITTKARNLVATGDEIATEYGIPVVNKRISVTPIALVGGAACKKPEDFVTIARTLDKCAKEVGVNFIGGYSALVSKGMTEAELGEELLKIYLKNGAQGHSFEPIIAYGAHAADPHHETDDSKGSYGDAVVLDVGCLVNGYCADMTRTVFIGKASEEAKKIYAIVKEANRRGIEAAKPGARFCDVDRAARDYIEEQGYGQYFTHRTGHNIGLEVHEFGDVSFTNEEVLKPGMCFSVEPGIYVPGGIGVRIEDLVLITEDGCEVLNHFTKDLIEVEA